MKMRVSGFSSNCLLIYLLASFNAPAQVAISRDEAVSIVEQSEITEQQRQNALDIKLSSVEVLDGAVADHGDRKVYFNRIAIPDETSRESISEDIDSKPKMSAEIGTGMTLAEWMIHAEYKPTVNVSLSGLVDEDGISELWWYSEDVHYRIYTNANFLYFTGIADFEDEENRYSIFMIATPDAKQMGKYGWRPKPEDFSKNNLEYFIVEGGDTERANPAAFAGVEAMLRYYSLNEEFLRIEYENRQKIQEAKRAYDLANPKQPRDVIINYYPVE